MLSPLLKKVLLYGGGFWLLCFGLSKFGLYWMRKDTPPFLVDMEEHLAENPRVVARIGEGAENFEYSYNNHDLEKDTLPYSFSMSGSLGRLRIEGYALKKQNQWVPVKADTLFTSSE
ncbi:hypothetical protein I2I05_20880 [Hymenobacter sp. BT683]|uniref:Uncharacterized protein n=1 Tax=Hymenobacter jeongseonensis TaxID=2791027 RepID=A0ABS0INA8_9BACT|nr:hypothetical protein [Hymenobacter jeongseonensis]MBF9239860.1 hypothetical protein [Hymenobacter jeongseonensis]